MFDFAGTPLRRDLESQGRDPPELAQDNPPPWSGGSTLDPLRLIPPGVIVWVLLVLIVSQLLFAFVPYRRRSYLPILLMTGGRLRTGPALGFHRAAVDQAGQANLLPALAFALLLQPVARFLPRLRSEPKEPKPSNPSPRT